MNQKELNCSMNDSNGQSAGQNRNKIHLKSPGNWVNDPNGFIYYNGMYHLFYQYFPYAPMWGTMHWGHAVSPDLVHWEHQGIALFPSKYEDQNGCFSGSAIEYEGRMYLFYTGVHYHQANPDNIHVCLDDQYESAQLCIVSEDGMKFDNFHRKQVIIPVIEHPAQGDRTHTRDPKVWRGKDAWYMVLGSTMVQESIDGIQKERNAGRLLIYKSSQLTEWKFANSIEKPGEYGWMWECPDYFEVSGSGVFIFSPMGFLKDGFESENQSICMLAHFQEESCTMDFGEEYQYLDYGLELYAPQSTLDAQGRRVLIAWLRMEDTADEQGNAWIGMFSIPRVVEVKDGHIYFMPHPNIRSQFTKRVYHISEALENAARVLVELQTDEQINIGGYLIFYDGTCVHTDRSAVVPYKKRIRTQFQTPPLKGGCRLEIYIDPNIIEIFINDGEYVISNSVVGLTGEIQLSYIHEWDVQESKQSFECEGKVQIYKEELWTNMT